MVRYTPVNRWFVFRWIRKVVFYKVLFQSNTSSLSFIQGVSRTRRIDKLGMRSSDTAELVFDNVHVPTENLIGEAGRGFQYQMQQFQEERMYAAVSGR